MIRPAASSATPSAAAVAPSPLRLATEAALVAASSGAVFLRASTMLPQAPWSLASAYLADPRSVQLVPVVAGASANAVSPLVRLVAASATTAGASQTAAVLAVAAVAGAIAVAMTFLRARWLGCGLLASLAVAASVGASATVFGAATTPNSWIVALACWTVVLGGLGTERRDAPALWFLIGAAALWILLAGDAAWLPWAAAAVLFALPALRWAAPWRGPLLIATLVTGVVAFCISATLRPETAGTAASSSAASLARTLLSLAGDGAWASPLARIVRAFADASRGLGLVGTGLVACAVVWGSERQIIRRTLLLGALGAGATTVAWETVSPEAVGAVVALSLAPAMAVGLGALASLPGQRAWRVLVAAWLVGAPLLAAWLAPRPTALVRADILAMARAVADADLLASDDWRRASVIVSAAAREFGRSPSYTMMDADAMRGAATRGTVVAIAGEARRRQLASSGLDFSTARVWGPPLDEALEGYGATRFVLFGMAHGAGLTPGAEPAAVTLGSVGGVTPLPLQEGGVAVAGWTGGNHAARELLSPGGFTLRVDEGQRLGKSRPIPANATIGVSSGVEITLNGQAVSRSDGGAALAIVDTMGRLERRAEWETGDPLSMPVAEADFGTLTRVTTRPCVSTMGRQVMALPVGVPARSVAVAADRGGTAVLFVAAASAPPQVTLGPDGDQRPVRADVMDLGTDAGRTGAEALAREADTTLDTVVGTDRFLARLEFAVTADEPVEVLTGLDTSRVSVAFVESSATVSACLVGSAAARAFEGRARRFEVPLGDVKTTGNGWHPLEREAGRWFRWTSQQTASLIVPLARVGGIAVTVDASAASGSDADDAVQLSVNGIMAGTPARQPGSSIRTWHVPTAAWRPGFNTLALGTPEVVVPAARGGSDDRRALGLAVRGVTLELSTAAVPASDPR